MSDETPTFQPTGDTGEPPALEQPWETPGYEAFQDIDIPGPPNLPDIPEVPPEGVMPPGGTYAPAAEAGETAETAETAAETLDTAVALGEGAEAAELGAGALAAGGAAVAGAVAVGAGVGIAVGVGLEEVTDGHASDPFEWMAEGVDNAWHAVTGDYLVDHGATASTPEQYDANHATDAATHYDDDWAQQQTQMGEDY